MNIGVALEVERQLSFGVEPPPPMFADIVPAISERLPESEEDLPSPAHFLYKPVLLPYETEEELSSSESEMHQSVSENESESSSPSEPSKIIMRDNSDSNEQVEEVVPPTQPLREVTIILNRIPKWKYYTIVLAN